MSLSENKNIMTRYHHLWSEGNLEGLRQMLADTCVTYNLVTHEARDVSFETEACKIWHDAFDDVEILIQQMVAEVDKVTVHWLLKSTHSHEFMGIPATGKSVVVPGIEINRLVDGKITEIWRLSDTMSVMQQLDVMHI